MLFRSLLMIFKDLFFKEKKLHLTQGFGLIELMVSVGIMILVTSIIMSRQDSFNGATLLRSQAYELALSIREIQLLAVSASNRIDANFRNVYGLYFNKSASDSSYQIFRDDESNKNYFYDNLEAFGQQGSLDKRFQIDGIYQIESGLRTSIGEVAITFERPNFDARFYTSGGVAVPSGVSAIEIDIKVRGKTEIRTVEITRTGQISVKNI